MRKTHLSKFFHTFGKMQKKEKVRWKIKLQWSHHWLSVCKVINKFRQFVDHRKSRLQNCIIQTATDPIWWARSSAVLKIMRLLKSCLLNCNTVTINIITEERESVNLWVQPNNWIPKQIVTSFFIQKKLTLCCCKIYKKSTNQTYCFGNITINNT